MIKLYTDQKLLIPENRRQVHPLLFDLHYYENAHKSVSKHYELVNEPEMADAFIFPVDAFSISAKNYVNEFRDLYVKAFSYGKKLMLYTGGDYGTTSNNDQIITWRNAGFKSTNDHQTIVIPSFINDPLQGDDLNLKIIDYQDKPQISFTGFANSSLKEFLRVSLSTFKANFNRFLKKDASDRQSIYNAAGKRFTYLKELESHPAIQTDFIYRDKYRAGAVTKEQREKSTAEFFQNLNNSPYTFCLRGAGNFSVRFYEAIACGRIPVLVDTDVVLPLENSIDWDQHICRVLPHENLPEKLIAFHKTQNETTFVELQQSNRALYENYLVRHAYFCQLHDSLKALL
ncbi:exostosin family protein [Nonlabens ulvanivorans]|uniref:exostosin domain-containing protein n=1 Tax=Nonlabens ulvanivorans TaxID=906888 RepID=UPI0037C9A2FC